MRYFVHSFRSTAGALLMAWVSAAVAAQPTAIEQLAQSGEPAPQTATPLPLRNAGDANSLAAIYELALQNDHTLAAARATYRAGLEEKNLGRALLLPRIDLAGDYDERDSTARGEFPAGGTLFPNSTDTDTETISFALSLTQPVFDLSAWFRFRRGQALSKQAEAEFAAEQQDLIVRVVEAYFNFLRAIANLRASRAQETAVQAQLEQARERFAVGMLAITDVHEAQAAFDLAVADRLTDEGALGIAAEQLSVLTGEPHHDIWRLRDDYPVINPDPMNSDEWVKFALEHNYDIKAAVHARNVARREARAAKAEHLPKVELSLGYSQRNSSVDQDDLVQDINSKFDRDLDEKSITLNVNVPLFAGGGISAARRQASARFVSAAEQHLGTVRNVTQQTRSLYIGVTSDVSRTRARRQAITSSRSALEASQAGYDVGTRDIVDVLDAQRTLFSAVRDHANTRFDYVVDKIQLKRQAGTLSPVDIYELNNWLQPPPSGKDTGDAVLFPLPGMNTPGN